MALELSRILNNDFLNKDPDIVPKQASPIILDIKSAVCMTKNGDGTQYSGHISRRVHFVRKCEKFNLYKKVWC